MTFGNRVVFRNPVPKATLAAGQTFMNEYYRRSYSRFAPRPNRPERVFVPQDWSSQIVKIRRELGLSQRALATEIGAASKAVVYQWECGKRRPSPVFWRRIEALVRTRVAAAAGQRPEKSTRRFTISVLG